MAEKLFDILTRNAFQTGNAISEALAAVKQEERDYVDQQVAVLAGKDANFSKVIDTILSITDAEAGSPEWDEGQNLYTLISEKYVAVADRVTANEGKIKALETFAADTTKAVSDYNVAVNARIDKEIIDRQTAVADLQKQINTNKTGLETANANRIKALTDLNALLDTERNERTESNEAHQIAINSAKLRLTTAEGKVTTLEGKVTALEEAMTLRTQEIDTLTVKQGQFEIRIAAMETWQSGLGDGTGITAEFKRGLSGQPSAYGHATGLTA